MTCPVNHGKMAFEKVEIPATMRAIRFYKCGKPEVLQMESDVPIPKFGKSQVLIRVLTIGVNPYETYQRSASYAEEFPGILGSDCAGIVAQVGSQVRRVKVGDRVYTTKTVSGSYAEYTVAKDVYTFPLHEDLTFSQGAALGVPYFTAYKALFMKAQCKPGETVLVHGASGGVGIACCQIARGHGLRVLGTAGSDYGLKKVKENGAHAVFNHQEHDTYIKKIKEFVGERGVDIILEMSASKNWTNDLSLLSSKGRLIVIGATPVKTTFYPGELIGLEKRVEGISVYSSTNEEYVEIAAALNAGVEAGWVKPVIREEFPLESAAEAHHEVMEHKNPSGGKIILSVC